LIQAHALKAYCAFTDTAPTHIYTLSLHDALPICSLSVFSCGDFLRVRTIVWAPGHSTGRFHCAPTQAGRRSGSSPSWPRRGAAAIVWPPTPASAARGGPYASVKHGQFFRGTST